MNESLAQINCKEARIAGPTVSLLLSHWNEGICAKRNKDSISLSPCQAPDSRPEFTCHAAMLDTAVGIWNPGCALRKSPNPRERRDKVEPRPTADVVDQYGAQAMVSEAAFVQYGGIQEFAGRIATVSCDDDLLLVSQRVCTPGDGRVLVVDAKGSLRVAFAGDGIGGLARDNGWSGLVIWGAIRDVDLVRQLTLGVSALGSTPRPAAKIGGGRVDEPVEFAGVTFRPGACLFSDSDGIVVVANDVL